MNIKSNIKNTNNEVIWDVVNSSFRQWIRYFDGRRHVGYSKSLADPEFGEHTTIISDWFIRMYKCGYLRPEKGVEFIEYQFNKDKKPIVRLFSNYYEIIDTADNWFPLWEFFDKFYESVRNKTLPSEIITSYYKERNTIKVDLDFTKKRFRSEYDLREFTRRNVARNYITQSQADQFIVDYYQTHGSF